MQRSTYLHFAQHANAVRHTHDWRVSNKRFSLWQQDLDDKLLIWVNQESWSYFLWMTPSKGLFWLVLTFCQSQRPTEKKSPTQGEGRLQERGGVVVTNVLWWSSRHQHNSHGVGVTGAWAPASHNDDNITSLEELAVLAYRQKQGGVSWKALNSTRVNPGD